VEQKQNLILGGAIPHRLRRTEIWLLEDHRFSRNADKYPAAFSGDVLFKYRGIKA